MKLMSIYCLICGMDHHRILITYSQPINRIIRLHADQRGIKQFADLCRLGLLLLLHWVN